MTKNLKDIDIYRLFLDLVSQAPNNGQYRVAPIIQDLPHKIGCSNDDYPMFFVETSDKRAQNDIKMEYFKVLFNRQCQWVNSNGSVELKKYTIIQLNSNVPELQRYFLQVVCLVLLKLPSIPSNSALRTEILNVINLFTSPASLSKDIIVGLWAELFVMCNSSDPEYLLTAWHVTPEDKYDFNDSESKVEVKATTGDNRQHSFSIQQLNPNPSSELMIASILMQPSGLGESIMTLMEMLYTKVSNLDLQYKLQSTVLQIVGPHWEEVSKMFFDFDYAKNTLAFYDSKEIPAISQSDVPAQVTNVKFVSDLSGVNPTSRSDFKCQLHKAL